MAIQIRLLTSRTIEVRFAYHAGLVAFVRKLPGAVWDKQSRSWHCDISAWAPIYNKLRSQVEVDYDVLYEYDQHVARRRENFLKLLRTLPGTPSPVLHEVIDRYGIQARPKQTQ